MYHWCSEVLVFEVSQGLRSGFRALSDINCLSESAKRNAVRKRTDRESQDVGNIVFFEHVNLTVPDQETATAFYVETLGFTRDPYMMVGTANMWVNVGEQQFHLPRGKPQQFRGHIGLCIKDLGGLTTRLHKACKTLSGTRYAFKVHKRYVEVTCPWGNQFRVFEADDSGGTTPGIPYVELLVPSGCASGIGEFYEQCLRTPCRMSKGKDGPAVEVCAGPAQRIVYRETRQDIPQYDGHHIAIYVANFSGPYRALKTQGLITRESNQYEYRFKDIVPPGAKRPVYSIEHEVRSLHHPLYRRPLVNRTGEERLP